MTDVAKPSVSIIIPCYNAEQWIVECLDSAIAQTHQPLEIIVIDDGSTDDSLKVIQSYAEKHLDLIRYETGPNRGGCAARNRGFALSRGEYVLFLDADDFISSNSIEELLKTVADYNGSIAASNLVRFFGKNGLIYILEETRTQYEDGTLGLREVLEYADFPPCSLLFPSRFVTSAGGWDETIHVRQDTDLLLRVLLQGVNIRISRSSVGYYRKFIDGTLSVSSRKGELQANSLIRIKERLKEGLLNAEIFQELSRSYAMFLVRMAGEMSSITEHRAIRQLLDEAASYGVYPTLPSNGVPSTLHRLTCLLLGDINKERLACLLSKVGIQTPQRRRSEWLKRTFG